MHPTFTADFAGDSAWPARRPSASRQSLPLRSLALGPFARRLLARGAPIARRRASPFASRRAGLFAPPPRRPVPPTFSRRNQTLRVDAVVCILDLSPEPDALSSRSPRESAAEGEEDCGEADQAKARQPAIFEAGDRRLVDAAEPFQVSLRIAQPQARRPDDCPEMAKCSGIASGDGLALVPEQLMLHASNRTMRRFALGSSAIRAQLPRRRDMHPMASPTASR